MSSLIDYSVIDYCLSKHLLFAAYTLAGETKFNLIISKSSTSKIVDSLDQLTHLKGFTLVPFSNKTKSSILIEPDFFLKEGEMSSSINELKQNQFKQEKDSVETTSQQTYFKSFDQFINAINASEFSKLVLSRVLSIEKKNIKLSELFKVLNQSYSAHFNYILYTPESGCWIGSSPEILYEEIENQAKTIALAGTQKKNSKHPGEYVWGAKEQKEQAFVVDYVEEILRNHLDGKYEKSSSTAIAANVAHLKTIFSFDKEDLKSKGNFIKELHPTPAVCGIPKYQAQSFIEKTESHDREYYSGFLGPVNLNSQSNLFVNLRCLKVGETQFHLFVGGGITKDSNAQKEWAETELKAETLLSIINKI